MAFIFMTFAWFVLIDMVRLLFYILDGLLSSRFGELLGSPKLGLMMQSQRLFPSASTAGSRR